MNLILVVMGVSGCGKSTYGRILAERFDLPFLDIDDFHTPEQMRKISFGHHPSEDEIYEILNTLAKKLATYAGEDGVVLACSALKESDRKLLGTYLDSPPQFIYLKGNLETIQQQIEKRSGHFFPPELLTREFQILEEPEDAIVVNLHPSLNFADSVEGLLLELI
ncbi:MAG: AAA family ATPase [Spirochaetes bacterium]|nr:AAA family ATPase [Spirochaetota bacterium]MBL7006108.1 AAA family ATPase [Spirochaetia bacterium]